MGHREIIADFGFRIADLRLKIVDLGFHITTNDSVELMTAKPNDQITARCLLLADTGPVHFPLFQRLIVSIGDAIQ
jgi:hypothetical protein